MDSLPKATLFYKVVCDQFRTGFMGEKYTCQKEDGHAENHCYEDEIIFVEWGDDTGTAATLKETNKLYKVDFDE